jgi:HlyD family secretion protein
MPLAPPNNPVSKRNQQKKSKTLKFAAIILILLGLISAAFAFIQYRSQKKLAEKIEKRKVTVELADVRRELILTGKVLPSSSAAVYSPTSGQIKKFFVVEGQSVKNDEKLFSVIQDTSGQKELEVSENEVSKAQLELRSAEENWERRKSVKDLFSETENRRAEDDVSRRKLELDAAEQRLALLKEKLGLTGSHVRRKKGDFDSVIFVKSPKSGVVTFINRTEGESVLATTENADSSGREVMTISDLDKMMVRSRILEADLAQVKVGTPVTVRLDAYRNKVYQGNIARISQQGVEDKSAGYTYFVTDVTFDRPDANVRSQMNATLEILVAEKKSVPTLPALAVATMGQNSVVERWGDKGKSEFVPIKTGLSNETLVEITDPSIKVGDHFLEIDFSTLDLKALSDGTLGTTKLSSKDKK